MSDKQNLFEFYETLLRDRYSNKFGISKEKSTPVLNWELVNKWRNYLEKSLDIHSPETGLTSLEEDWEMLSQKYQVINREDNEKTASNPLDAFFYYVDIGFYPPPEILLAMNEAYEIYINSAGKFSLEEVFFGKARQKEGSHAKRKNITSRNMIINLVFNGLLNRGNTRIQAAETISELLGGTPDPESILRMLRKLRPPKKPD